MNVFIMFLPYLIYFLSYFFLSINSGMGAAESALDNEAETIKSSPAAVISREMINEKIGVKG